MSSVDVMTLSGPLAACAIPAAATVMNCRRVMFIADSLKRMRPVRADTELKLEQQLVRITKALIAAMAILRPNLAELARPVGDENRLLCVRVLRADQPVCPVDSYSAEPAPRELVFGRSVKTESLAQCERLLAMVPDHFGAAKKGAINGAAQWFPANGRIHPVNPADQEIPLCREQQN